MDVRAAREMGNVRVGEVPAQAVVDRGLVGRCGRVAGVEQMVGRFGVGVRGRDIRLQRVGEAPGDGHDAVLAVLAVAHLERRAGRVDVAQLQVERFGDAQPGRVEDPEQHRVNQRPVRHLRQRLGIDRVKQAADLLVAEHIRRRPVPRLHAGQRRRRPRRPAELAGVLCQVAQDDLLATDRRRLEVAAVEEPLDGLLDDRPVRVPVSAAVLGELRQHPCLAVVPEPAGAARRDERRDQFGQRRRGHDRAPASRTSSTSSAQWRRCSVSSLR